jgi:hypothetical protein
MSLIAESQPAQRWTNNGSLAAESARLVRPSDPPPAMPARIPATVRSSRSRAAQAAYIDSLGPRRDC